MSAPVIDTLEFAEGLKAAGAPAPQAEATARLVADAIASANPLRPEQLEQAVATLGSRIELGEGVLRADLAASESRLRTEIRASEAALRSEIRAGEATLRSEIQVSEAKLNSRIDTSEATLRGEIRALAVGQAWMRWMLGLILAGMVSLVLKAWG